LQGGADDPNAETSGPRVTDITLLMNIQTPSNDEYYQTVVINSLVSVLNDATLKEHHYEAVEAVMLIFRTQRLRCVSFLPQVSISSLCCAPPLMPRSDLARFPQRDPDRPTAKTRSLPEAIGELDFHCQTAHP
jgi:hypothetical protein